MTTDPALPSAKGADAAGIALATVLGAWVAFGAGGGAGDAGPLVMLVVGAAALCAAGRWLAEREPLAVHRLVALGVGGAVVLTLPGVLRSGGAPLGYANANAALVGLGVLAALGIAVTEPVPWLRARWAILAGGLALAILGTRSVAGAVCLCAALALFAASTLTRRPAAVVLGGAVAVAFMLGGTEAIARGGNPAGIGDRVGERGELWAAAADLTAEHPLRGVGPGGFAAQNPVSGDADLRWAHQDYLQVAAETGLVGLSLVLAVVAWAFARLALAALRGAHHAGLGAAALTMVALHATVDHVLHHPAVVLTLAFLVGAATAGHPRRVPGSPGSHRPRR